MLQKVRSFQIGNACWEFLNNVMGYSVFYRAFALVKLKFQFFYNQMIDGSMHFELLPTYFKSDDE
jgi:hypothetical protein